MNGDVTGLPCGRPAQGYAMSVRTSRGFERGAGPDGDTIAAGQQGWQGRPGPDRTWLD